MKSFLIARLCAIEHRRDLPFRRYSLASRVSSYHKINRYQNRQRLLLLLHFHILLLHFFIDEALQVLLEFCLKFDKFHCSLFRWKLVLVWCDMKFSVIYRNEFYYQLSFLGSVAWKEIFFKYKNRLVEFIYRLLIENWLDC